ncbi:desert hedgehog protein [Denticeps clupeoides]|uniref:Hedgehog protein n=1 Tax=Denticeps clupeoides TaxID=299321 RepID=A0AAY4EL61_9TELE|nr:desert hedgehog protein [Denticeps clupeoides]
MATSPRLGPLAACACAWLLLLLAHACGPGPGYGTRPRARRLVPMKYKQYAPQISEGNLGASGRAEGKITRDSERFRELVPNYNIHVVFKDEEHTQADRFMTRRCKDCLDRLALAVMLQWPNTRLRVTEAWDEDGNHPPDSLHYEGRAVDITTSDRNTSKYGLLAQLAVEAGFDWVYYESKHHIHCSVKADHSVALERGGCFPGSAQVHVAGGGRKSMSSLKPGDTVLAATESGRPVLSQVLLFLHQDRERTATFLVLGTEDGQRLALSRNHLVFRSTRHEKHLTAYQACFAARVKRGDYVLTHGTNGRVQPSRIASVTQEERRGVYAPLTEHGTLFVDGVLASSYATVEDHGLAHWAFGLLRYVSSLTQLFQALSPGEEHLGRYTSNRTWRNETPNTSGDGRSKRPSHHCNQTAVEPRGGRAGQVHWYARALYVLGRIVLDPQKFYS